MDHVKRLLSTEIVDMANYYPIVTVMGPRQSGKTTVVRKLFPQKPYVSLENPDVRHFAKEDPRGFLEQYPKGAILDEIQRVPELLSYLQGIVDSSDQKGLFVLTGSHQLALHETISQSLAGRTALLTLMPFSFAELDPYSNVEELEDYLLKGMYPRVYRENIDPTKFYRDYVQTYLERDVRQLINVKDLMRFQQFLKLCAGRIGQVFNAHSLSNELGISHQTVQNWLSILEASFLIYRLPPYFENLGKRVIKSPKFYFADVGIATYLLDIHSAEQLSHHPLRGALVENWVVMECVKYRLHQGFAPSFYFYRDSNQQGVDLLYKRANHLIPIVIKPSKTFHVSFLKSLRYFKKVAHDRFLEGFLIYSGTQEQRLESFQVLNFRHLTKVFQEDSAK